MVVPIVVGWLHEFWSFYRRYTNTAVHTAATAALAIFGILVFVDPLFAVLAIVSYLLPPVVLYARTADTPIVSEGGTVEADLPDPADERSPGNSPHTPAVADSTRSGPTPEQPGDGDRPVSSAGDGAAAADRDDGDTDSDRDDGDTDSDRDDGDTGADSDGDTDSDRNG